MRRLGTLRRTSGSGGSSGGNFIPLSQKDSPNGVAPLDSNSHVPLDNLPITSFAPQGTWDANANNTSMGTSLASGVGTVGDIWIVSVAGSTNLDGITSWAVDDRAVFTVNDVWVKVPGDNLVTSVNGMIGAVVLGLGNINDVTVGSPQTNDVIRYNGTGWENKRFDFPLFLRRVDMDLTTEYYGGIIQYDDSDAETLTVPSGLAQGFCFVQVIEGQPLNIAAGSGVSIIGPSVVNLNELVMLVGGGTTWRTYNLGGGSSSTPTLQQVLTAGALLSGANTIETPDNLTLSNTSTTGSTGIRIEGLGTVINNWARGNSGVNEQTGTNFFVTFPGFQAVGGLVAGNGNTTIQASTDGTTLMKARVSIDCNASGTWGATFRLVNSSGQITNTPIGPPKVIESGIQTWDMHVERAMGLNEGFALQVFRSSTSGSLNISSSSIMYVERIPNGN